MAQKATELTASFSGPEHYLYFPILLEDHGVQPGSAETEFDPQMTIHSLVS